MKGPGYLSFPQSFTFGTSTSAYQIETAFEHDWVGHKSRDGHLFLQTTDHEKRYDEDIQIISKLAPNYRMSLMWSRLQRAPFASFDREVVREYHTLLERITATRTKIMMVIHHFANPTWFASRGGWMSKKNVALFVDYANKLVDEFGRHVTIWNTFNEPNLYASMGWVAGEFPPHKKNILAAKTVVENIGSAHNQVYKLIKEKFPEKLIGISHNCTVFGADNAMGVLPARFSDFVYMQWAPEQFTQTDFFGMSYYARIGFDPKPVTYLFTPEKLHRAGKAHDDMWEYYPRGLGECIDRYWRKFGKPIIITENGICTADDRQRVKAIRDYLGEVHSALNRGVDIRGYYHWSAWDNFEWNLGPTYQFGLYACDPITKARSPKPSAQLFAAVAHSNKLDNQESDSDNR